MVLRRLIGEVSNTSPDNSFVPQRVFGLTDPELVYI